MTSLTGRIEDGVLPNLLQYLSLSHASGCLMLRHPQKLHASIYVEDGRVVFVDARPLYDLAALAALLHWKDGRFAFRPGVRSPRKTLTSSTETLLLQATQKADEISGSGGDGVDADSVLMAINHEPIGGSIAGGASGSRPSAPTGGGRQSGWRGAAASDDAHRQSFEKTHEGAYETAYEKAYEFGPVTLLGDPLAEAQSAAPAAPDTVSLSLSALDLWRRLDGNSSLRQLAAEAGRPVDAFVRAANELFDNALVDYVSLVVADPRFAQELAREAVDLLGPVGEIVVEDALYELGLTVDTIPVGKVDELVQLLEIAFDNPFSRAEFLRRVRELRQLFALEAPEAGGD